MRYKNKKFYTNKIFKAFVAVLILCSLLIFTEKSGVTNFIRNTKEDAVKNDAQTTSNQPSAQSDFTDGDNREPGNTIREDSGSASISDNAGLIDKSIDRSTSESSPTGEITLFTPVKNTLVTNKLPITGTSTLAVISYRVIDNVSGMIASGELQVVNGQFSGILNIETHASEGRLDIFGIKEDGNEFSNIAIPLRFY